MAKFNIEVDLDWIEEDGTIDSVLKEEIISQVTNRIVKITSDKIEERISGLIEKQVNEAEKLISDKLSALLDDFLNRKRMITDKWGDVKQTDVTVMDMLKTACDNFIDGYVGRDGNPISANSYGDKKRRIDYIIEREIDSKLTYSVERAAKEIKTKLQNYIDETLKAQIGENVVQLLGLDQIKNKM